ncbi:16S rRNA (guanine(527)-N(7))-methyltransferase RsmG [Phaeovulum sp.]|uniref:16S rRNA (guanine(527)-N(7))-methyltransferase RsmG n=1 Tax=Phaeovulum sp. TaxID=2934796 RepID=UPI0039E647B8
MTGAEEFARQINVSRETLEGLGHYENLLKRWNPSVNLVSSSSLREVWSRHFLDSAQLFSIADIAQGHWVDLGSGAGFPGLIIAILTRDTGPRVTLIESDQRKCAFLATVVRELGLDVQILPNRIEKVSPQHADVLSARALAPLSKLLAHAERHLSPTGTAVFPKGERWQSEVSDARKHWTFDAETCPSRTEPAAVVLKIKGVRRV